MNTFTKLEEDAAWKVYAWARAFAFDYASREDIDAATQAILQLALEKTGARPMIISRESIINIARRDAEQHDRSNASDRHRPIPFDEQSDAQTCYDQHFFETLKDLRGENEQ